MRIRTESPWQHRVLRARPDLVLFRLASGLQMNSPNQSTKTAPEDSSSAPQCRAELIFYAKTRQKESRPVTILGEYTCDCRRPDWPQRWQDWSTSANPFLNLFLCREHAKKLGLLN
jgi:hypothetical protein